MPEGNAENELLQHVKHALEEIGYTFAEETERSGLRIGVNCSNGYVPCLLLVCPDYPMIWVYSQLQCRVPEEKRLPMADFLNRANATNYYGNFEMDANDGSVRYRTALDLADGVLTTRMLSSLMGGNFDVFDRYLPGMMSLIWNDIAAEDAIGLCEEE